MAQTEWDGTQGYTVHRGNLIREQRRKTIRDDAILTTSYVDTDWIDCAGSNQIVALCKYTQGSLTSLEMQIWWSLDGTTWYQEPSETVSAGTTLLTLQKYTFAEDENFFVALQVFGRYLKLKFKGTGTVTGSTLQVDLMGRY